MLPNLLVIGAAKSGTTSLHTYLGAHPDVGMSAQKELRYFWRDDWREAQPWYEAQFDPGKRVRGESSPAYTMWPLRPHVPERAAQLVPDAKLVYVVRDPIERLPSQFRQRLEDGYTATWEAYMADLEAPDNAVVAPSRYATQLERWLDHFDRSQLLVLDHHDLLHDRTRLVNEVFAFLGVTPLAAELPLGDEMNRREDKLALRVRNPALTAFVRRRVIPPFRRLPPGPRRALKRPLQGIAFRSFDAAAPIDDALRERLVAHLAPEVDRLRALTGLAFPHWSL